jgi:MoxR-like ATPase
MSVEAQVQQFRQNLDALRKEIGTVIVGQEDVVRQVLLCLLAGGHAMLEGVPGLGKTLLVRTLSQSLALSFSRIQFTPDLMPADIIGTHIVVEDEQRRRTFQFQRGPVFGNVILADEINRATPKTQSALLEAMQEHAVTVAGTRYALEEPFVVLATQNPIEMEGTYPLPEAQLDRFLLKILVKSPSQDELVAVLDRTTGREEAKPRALFSAKEIVAMRDLAREVEIATHVKTYAARIVLASHPEGKEAPALVKRYVRYGASPRGAQALVLAAKVLALLRGRYNVSFGDLREVAAPALRHRLILNFEGEAEGIKTDQVVAKLLEEIPEASTEVQSLARGT